MESEGQGTNSLRGLQSLYEGGILTSQELCNEMFVSDSEPSQDTDNEGKSWGAAADEQEGKAHDLPRATEQPEKPQNLAQEVQQLG